MAPRLALCAGSSNYRNISSRSSTRLKKPHDADGGSRLVAATISPTTSALSSDASQLIAAVSRQTAPAPPVAAPTPYRDDQGRLLLSRLLIVLDSSIGNDQPLAYSWLTQSGVVDTPGATRTSADECDADALLAVCLRSLVFPPTLLRRIVGTVTPTALAQRCRWASTPTGTDVAVYVVTATQEELDGVHLTPADDSCGARLRPFVTLEPSNAIRISPIADALTVTLEAQLRSTRLAFLDWSVSPGMRPTTSSPLEHLSPPRSGARNASPPSDRQHRSQ